MVVQGVVELVNSPAMQGAVAILGTTGFGALVLRWDRRISKMDARVSSMCTTEAMKDHLSKELKAVSLNHEQDHRSLRDEVAGLIADMQLRQLDQDKLIGNMRVSCAKRHGNNGIST